MTKQNDPNTFSQYFPLKTKVSISGKIEDKTIGNVYATYRISAYNNVQLKDASSIERKKQQQYIVQCTQRINIYNPSGTILKPEEEENSYDNYPVLMNTFMALTNTNDAVTLELLDYSPQTVNTKIQSSGTQGSSTGETSGSSNSSTVGSSTSQTNSFGASVSVGMDGPSASANYEHSSTHTKDHSHTSTSDQSATSRHDASETDGMSIKDWGAYGLVNPVTNTPTWTFGQEYPWDAIECRKTNTKTRNDQLQIIIPSAMAVRLYDGTCLYPPSQLSMFGINFVMKALWRVTLPNDLPQEISVQQVINYFSASHALIKPVSKRAVNDAATLPHVEVYMDPNPTQLIINEDTTLVTKIDLLLMSMAALGTTKRPAIVGFIPNKFIVQPKPIDSSGPAKLFKMLSESKSLYIKDTTNYLESGQDGAGFSCSETALKASFSENCTSLKTTIYFKVVDQVVDYVLYIKHWKIGNSDLQLTFTFNEDTDNQLVKYVESQEAEGGEDNLLAINLRNQNYANIDYHDYLQLGLNSISIEIKTLATGPEIPISGYQVRAISIENG